MPHMGDQQVRIGGKGVADTIFSGAAIRPANVAQDSSDSRSAALAAAQTNAAGVIAHRGIKLILGRESDAEELVDDPRRSNRAPRKVVHTAGGETPDWPGGCSKLPADDVPIIGGTLGQNRHAATRIGGA